MSYVDVYHDRKREQINIVERVDGQRRYNTYPAEYVFYYEDPNGSYTTIYDTPASRVSARTRRDFQRELALHSGKKIFEHDINPVNRCLENHYHGLDAPDLHIAYFDIETDFEPPTRGQGRGYACDDMELQNPRREHPAHRTDGTGLSLGLWPWRQRQHHLHH